MNGGDDDEPEARSSRPTSSDGSDEDPLELYDELVQRGTPPDPGEFAARYPGERDLLERIAALERLRQTLDAAAGQLGAGARAWPQRVDDFELGALIGEGSAGAVFRARRAGPSGTALSRSGDVAVKLLRSGSRLAIERFRREAELLARLEHPGIARLLAWGFADGWPYLVTELVAGTTWRERLRAQGLPGRNEVGEVAALGREIALALGYAHARGVVHRDVKPSNVMLTPDGTCKVIDFGLAVRPGSDARLTRTGVFLGSHGYAAPEQLRGERTQVGPWTDVWGLGASLYEALAARPAFAHPTLGARVGHADTPLEHGPRKHNRAVSRRLDALVARCLAIAPAKRFADGAALAAALAAVED